MPGDTTRGVVVILNGEYDIARTADLRDAILLAHSDEERMILDMSEVAFIDSSGLQVLLEVHSVLAEQGTVLTIHEPSSIVRRVLALTGMSGLFGVDD